MRRERIRTREGLFSLPLIHEMLSRARTSRSSITYAHSARRTRSMEPGRAVEVCARGTVEVDARTVRQLLSTDL